jgi:hypothetical protein
MFLNNLKHVVEYKTALHPTEQEDVLH